MNRYRSARRAPSSSTAATPIVAFLLIACFGLLFVTGCSSSRVSEQKTQDDTFTAEDVQRFQQLAQEGGQHASSSSTGALAGTDSSPVPAAMLPATGSAATLCN